MNGRVRLRLRSPDREVLLQQQREQELIEQGRCLGYQEGWAEAVKSHEIIQPSLPAASVYRSGMVQVQYSYRITITPQTPNRDLVIRVLSRVHGEEVGKPEEAWIYEKEWALVANSYELDEGAEFPRFWLDRLWQHVGDWVEPWSFCLAFAQELRTVASIADSSTRAFLTRCAGRLDQFRMNMDRRSTHSVNF